MKTAWGETSLPWQAQLACLGNWQCSLLTHGEMRGWKPAASWSPTSQHQGSRSWGVRLSPCPCTGGGLGVTQAAVGWLQGTACSQGWGHGAADTELRHPVPYGRGGRGQHFLMLLIAGAKPIEQECVPLCKQRRCLL